MSKRSSKSKESKSVIQQGLSIGSVVLLQVEEKLVVPEGVHNSSSDDDLHRELPVVSGSVKISNKKQFQASNYPRRCWKITLHGLSEEDRVVLTEQSATTDEYGSWSIFVTEKEPTSKKEAVEQFHESEDKFPCVAVTGFLNILVNKLGFEIVPSAAPSTVPYTLVKRSPSGETALPGETQQLKGSTITPSRNRRQGSHRKPNLFNLFSK